MTVDIKSLRIGSHVEYNGKRVCVDEICTLRPKDAPMRLIVSRNRLVYGNPSIDEVEPIAITPELLKELGFEQDMRFVYGKAFKMECGEMWIGVSAMSKGFWRIEAMDDTYNYGNCIIRHLHEAEAFLALHDVELIPD